MEAAGSGGGLFLQLFFLTLLYNFIVLRGKIKLGHVIY